MERGSSKHSPREDDALAEDNTAWLAARKPPPVRVSVESADRFFLENSVVAFSTGEDFFTLVTEKPEVVIAKGMTPDADLAVIFQPAGESPTPSRRWSSSPAVRRATGPTGHRVT